MGTGPSGIEIYAPAVIKAARSEANTIIRSWLEEFILNGSNGFDRLDRLVS
jgi:hypothetical protein